MNPKINEAGLALIKKFESLHDGDLSAIGLQPKQCPAGIWTVGYGHALRGKSGKFLTGPSGKAEAYALYNNMSVEWADDLLQQDVEYFASAISGFIRVPVTENQFSALVSLGYNIGINALKNSTVIKRLNAGNTESAAEAILWWNKASGKVLGGLVLRREAEKDLFSKP